MNKYKLMQRLIQNFLFDALAIIKLPTMRTFILYIHICLKFCESRLKKILRDLNQMKISSHLNFRKMELIISNSDHQIDTHCFRI